MHDFHLFIYPSTHILIRLALHLIRGQQLAEIMLWDPGICSTGTIPTSTIFSTTCHNPFQPTNLLSRLTPRFQSSCQREETQEKQETGRRNKTRGRRKRKRQKRKEGSKEQGLGLGGTQPRPRLTNS